MRIVNRLKIAAPMLFAACLCLLAHGTARAAYPDRPIRILVGGAPGSVPDAMIRRGDRTGSATQARMDRDHS